MFVRVRPHACVFVCVCVCVCVYLQRLLSPRCLSIRTMAGTCAKGIPVRNVKSNLHRHATHPAYILALHYREAKERRVFIINITVRTSAHLPIVPAANQREG